MDLAAVLSMPDYRCIKFLVLRISVKFGCARARALHLLLPFTIHRKPVKRGIASSHARRNLLISPGPCRLAVAAPNIQKTLSTPLFDNFCSTTLSYNKNHLLPLAKSTTTTQEHSPPTTLSSPQTCTPLPSSRSPPLALLPSPLLCR